MVRDKAWKRYQKRKRERYAPRGGASDRRPQVVVEDRGRIRRLVRQGVL